MRHLLFIAAMLFGVCQAQSIRVIVEARKDTFFVYQQKAMEILNSYPPQYRNYVNIHCDTLFRKDTAIIREIQEYELKKAKAILDYYKFNR